MNKLYIGGLLAETSMNTSVLMTYSQGEVSEPSVVKNSFSQSVQLPITKANDEIFKAFRRNDYSGAFNPLKRVSFELRNDMEEILESGYCKLDEMDPSAAGYYSITLYGGLGAFLWSLKYTSDGDLKTLADLTYAYTGGSYHGNGLTHSKAVVSAAWAALANNTNGVYQVLNFAPALNGHPSDFDADKAISSQVVSQGYDNIKTPVGYTTPHGIITLSMNRKHSEWETMDIRANYQRQVIKVSALLNAIATAAAPTYNVTISSTFLSSLVGQKMWMVLPYPTEDMGALQLTDSPTDYLLAIVKMFGLHIYAERNNINIMTDTEYYDTATLIDLTDRVDKGSRKVTPISVDHRYFDLALEAEGTFAGTYRTNYGRQYGSQRINTGFEFDEDTTELLDGVSAKGAADVLDTQDCYRYLGDSGTWKNFPIAAVEPCSFVATNSGNEDEEISTDWYKQRTSQWWGSGHSLFSALPEFNTDGNPTDATGVFLLYDSFATLPVLSGYNFWHISENGNSDLLTANENRECWDLRYGSPNTAITQVPIFRRNSPYIGRSLEMGKPQLAATKDEWANLTTIYEDWWQDFVKDRYGKDARVMTTKVNLEGWQVGNNLLRKFYYLDGAIWQMLKIKDHDRDSHALTTCEFIKVMDKTAYQQHTQGTILIAPARSILSSIAPEITFTVTANGTWSIAVTNHIPFQILNVSPISGGTAGERTETTVTLSTATIPAGETRWWTLTITDAASGKKITQEVYEKSGI